MIYTIRYPDRNQGDALKTIIWNDVTRTVKGGHSGIKIIRRLFRVKRFTTEGGKTILRDPGRNKSEFLAIVTQLGNGILDSRAIFPKELRGIVPAIYTEILPPGVLG